jgi:DNA-binding LytR/AlgR family response regulator
MIRVLVAEDEPYSRNLLTRLLREWSEVEVVGEARDGDEALDLALALRPDALFLDVEMPGLRGTELARRLPTPRPGLVFVTAHPIHAVDAFALGAVHYLLKPVSRPHLAQALARLRPDSSREWLRLPVRRKGSQRFLHPAAVDALVADLGDCLAWTAEGPLRVEGTLAHWEERLEAHGFLRVHRNALVRLEAVQGVDASQRLVVPGGTLEVSRRRFEALREALSPHVPGV